jgi:hypothetical protein
VTEESSRPSRDETAAGRWREGGVPTVARHHHQPQPRSTEMTVTDNAVRNGVETAALDVDAG